MARSVQLDRLPYFVAVAKHGGFTAAARELGATKAVVSQQIARLEDELGGALFQRTTRTVRLTDAGRRLLDECAPHLGEVEAAIDRFGTALERPTGTFRVTTVPEYAASILGPALARFAREHPALRVHLIATADVLDLVDDRIDLAIRFGTLRDSSLRAATLSSFEQYVVASPDYLARAGTPTRPEALETHAFIALSMLRKPLSWSFDGARGRATTPKLVAASSGNSTDAALGLARGGAGISILPDYAVKADLESGRLVRILERFALPSAGIHAVYPATRKVPTNVRVFLAFFRRQLAARA